MLVPSKSSCFNGLLLHFCAIVTAESIASSSLPILPVLWCFVPIILAVLLHFVPNNRHSRHILCLQCSCVETSPPSRYHGADGELLNRVMSFGPPSQLSCQRRGVKSNAVREGAVTGRHPLHCRQCSDIFTHLFSVINHFLQCQSNRKEGEVLRSVLLLYCWQQQRWWGTCVR